MKSGEELARMRDSCRIAAQVRDTLVRCAAPGVTTRELDEYAGELIAGLGARSGTLGYRGYPGHVCVSVNEEVVHGVPSARRLALGDVVSIDVVVEYGGYFGDTTTTVGIGETPGDVARLVAVTAAALERAIAKSVAGGRLSDISHAIETAAAAAGFGVVRDFVGHGIGAEMHEEPQIPNFGPAGQGPTLRPGMTLAIEPMISLGSGDVEVQRDGWTVLTRDRRPAAHFEHTVAVRNGAAEVMTR